VVPGSTRPPPRWATTVAGVADREVDDALARSFLAQLPAELAGRLREEGERADFPAGTTVYRAGSDPQAALVVSGLIRVFLSSAGGRQVTVREQTAVNAFGSVRRRVAVHLLDLASDRQRPQWGDSR